jgi:hypothetical protein
MLWDLIYPGRQQPDGSFYSVCLCSLTRGSTKLHNSLSSNGVVPLVEHVAVTGENNLSGVYQGFDLLSDPATSIVPLWLMDLSFCSLRQGSLPAEVNSIVDGMGFSSSINSNHPHRWDDANHHERVPKYPSPSSTEERSRASLPPPWILFDSIIEEASPCGTFQTCWTFGAISP